MLPLNGEEGAKLEKGRRGAWVAGRDSKVGRLGMTGSWSQGPSWPAVAAGGRGDGSPVGSGQFQELLQCVLFHSLHEKLIVLGEGRGEMVNLSAGVLSQV